MAGDTGYTLEYDQLQVLENFESIPHHLRLTAARLLESLKDDPRPRSHEKLEGGFRYAKDGIKIVYDVDDANRRVYVVRVALDPLFLVE